MHSGFYTGVGVCQGRGKNWGLSLVNEDKRRHTDYVCTELATASKHRTQQRSSMCARQQYAVQGVSEQGCREQQCKAFSATGGSLTCGLWPRVTAYQLLQIHWPNGGREPDPWPGHSRHQDPTPRPCTHTRLVLIASSKIKTWCS